VGQSRNGSKLIALGAAALGALSVLALGNFRAIIGRESATRRERRPSASRTATPITTSAPVAAPPAAPQMPAARSSRQETQQQARQPPRPRTVATARLGRPAAAMAWHGRQPLDLAVKADDRHIARVRVRRMIARRHTT